MKKIAIFGANGNIGSQAVKAFGDAGWQVRAITRDGRYQHAEGIETVHADAMIREQTIAATKGCEVILNCVNPPYPKWQEMCMPIASNMMAAAEQHNAVHLFPANVYNYGTKIPAMINDLTPMAPDIKKGKIRQEMEALFQEYAIQRDVQTIILRAGDFLGGINPRSSWFDTVITKSLAKSKMIYPGPMDIIHSWAYLPDLAQAFVAIAENSDEFPKFESFVFKGHAITGEQLKTAMEQALGKSLRLSGIPWPLLRLAGLFSPMLREVCEMAYLWNTPHQLDDSKLQNRFDHLPNTPLVQVVSRTLAGISTEFPEKHKLTIESNILRKVQA